jgi:hypothetical protein
MYPRPHPANDTYDLGCQRRLHNLDHLQTKARAINRRLLDTERVGQGCVLASPACERITHPTTTVDGRSAPALRFGDPRVQALAATLCHTLYALSGITNKSLRALMTGLLGDSYTMNRANYDLTRLRRNGLITRFPTEAAALKCVYLLGRPGESGFLAEVAREQPGLFTPTCRTKASSTGAHVGFSGSSSRRWEGGRHAAMALS